MRSVLRRRPSASMAVSVAALVVALSGTAVAATTLVNGDKLIRKGTLSGNRLRRHTLTGTQINLRKLGTVPKAKRAATAGSAGYARTAGSAATATSATSATDATNATNATNAANATNAGNAAALGGQPPSSYLTTGNRIGTHGVVSVGGSSPGTKVTLFAAGPFTVTMTCTLSGTGNSATTALALDVTTSEAKSVIDGEPDAPVDTPVQLGAVSATGTTAGTVQFDTFTFEAPSGTGPIFSGSFDVNSLGSTHNCWVNLAGID